MKIIIIKQNFIALKNKMFTKQALKFNILQITKL